MKEDWLSFFVKLTLWKSSLQPSQSRTAQKTFFLVHVDTDGFQSSTELFCEESYKGPAAETRIHLAPTKKPYVSWDGRKLNLACLLVDSDRSTDRYAGTLLHIHIDTIRSDTIKVHPEGVKITFR